VSVNGFFLETDNAEEETYLYDPNIVLGLEFVPGVGAKFSPQISPKNPGFGLAIRPLSNGDFERGRNLFKDVQENVDCRSKNTWELKKISLFNAIEFNQ